MANPCFPPSFPSSSASWSRWSQSLVWRPPPHPYSLPQSIAVRRSFPSPSCRPRLRCGGIAPCTAAGQAGVREGAGGCSVVPVRADGSTGGVCRRVAMENGPFKHRPLPSISSSSSPTPSLALRSHLPSGSSSAARSYYAPYHRRPPCSKLHHASVKALAVDSNTGQREMQSTSTQLSLERDVDGVVLARSAHWWCLQLLIEVFGGLFQFMNITEVRLATQSHDGQIRNVAEWNIKHFKEQIFPQFLQAPSDKLLNNNKPPVSRKLDGIFLQNSLDASDLARK